MRNAKRRLALFVVVTAALAVTPFLLAATSGGAASLALVCGQHVTASVTLTADLTGCGSNGLVIDANGLTINLNGHTISGSSSPGLGIADTTGNYSVTVENGTISGFARGVDIEGGTASHLSGLRVTGNGVGIFTFYPAVITGNVVYSNTSVGINVGCCVNAKVSITNNVVNDNAGGGISVPSTATGSVITGNRVLSNTGYGIAVSANGATVSGNTANANTANGLVLYSVTAAPPLKATGNKAYFNTQLGINLGPGDTDGGGNKAAGNGTAHQCENIVCS
jgi:parallel beta-helix repeat protein